MTPTQGQPNISHLGCLFLIIVFIIGCYVMNENVRKASHHGNTKHGWYSKYNDKEKTEAKFWFYGIPISVFLIMCYLASKDKDPIKMVGNFGCGAFIIVATILVMNNSKSNQAHNEFSQVTDDVGNASLEPRINVNRYSYLSPPAMNSTSYGTKDYTVKYPVQGSMKKITKKRRQGNITKPEKKMPTSIDKEKDHETSDFEKLWNSPQTGEKKYIRFKKKFKPQGNM